MKTYAHFAPQICRPTLFSALRWLRSSVTLDVAMGYLTCTMAIGPEPVPPEDNDAHRSKEALLRCTTMLLVCRAFDLEQRLGLCVLGGLHRIFALLEYLRQLSSDEVFGLEVKRAGKVGLDVI